MKRLQLFGLMLMAVFALGAAVTATASAAERGVLTLVVEPTVLALGENLANIGKLASNGKSIECKKMWILHIEMGPVAGSGGKHFNLTNKDLDIHFSECKTGGLFSCKTGTDPAGVILVLTLVHLINLLDKEKGNLVPGFAALVLNEKLENKPLLIECTSFGKIEVRGTALGIVEPLNAKKEITLTEEVEKVGVEAKEKVVCDKENEKVCEELLKNSPLEANFLGTEFLSATEVTQLETLTVKPDVLWDD